MSNRPKIFDDDYLSLIARLLVGGIFIYASLDKLAQPAQFARIVFNYHLIPIDLINIMAIILPWVELICGISVILGLYRQGGLIVLNFLVILFIIAIAVNVFRGVDLECGCFTVSSRARGSALELIFRDLGLLIISLYALINRSRRFQISKL